MSPLGKSLLTMVPQASSSDQRQSYNKGGQDMLLLPASWDAVSERRNNLIHCYL